MRYEVTWRCRLCDHVQRVESDGMPKGNAQCEECKRWEMEVYGVGPLRRKRVEDEGDG